MKFKLQYVSMLVVSVMLMSGCYVSIDHNEPNEYIYITEILIEDEVDFNNGRLEVEVHLVDAVTERLLGCSGHEDGLRQVDFSDVLYETNARLYSFRYDDYLTLDDIRGRDVYLVVIEKDTEQCPSPYDPLLDDIIGVSRVFEGESLFRQREFSFENVRHIRIGS